MKKLILSIFVCFLLIGCKKEITNNNEFKNQIIDSLSNLKKATDSISDTKKPSPSIKSFTIDCGSGCAMTYNEVTRKNNTNSIEIKYEVSQYIDEKVEDGYFETYIFESDSNGFLNSIHLTNYSENIINDEESIIKEYLLKIGYELYPQKEKTTIDSSEKNSNQAINSLFKKFEFKYTVTEIETDEDIKTLIKMSLTNKESKKNQDINFIPESLIIKFDANQSNSISYFDTRKIIIKSAQQIEGGHSLIVLDYNFDGLEDFAIINYEGSNGGPQYAYYKQKPNGRFELDESFTNEIRFFPLEINNKEKTLKFGHPSGCCQINTFMVKIQPNGKWKEIYSKLEDIN